MIRFRKALMPALVLAMLFVFVFSTIASASSPPQVELVRSLDAHAVARLGALAPEQTARVTLRQNLDETDADVWTLRRLDVYAPDAQLWVATPQGLEPIPRSPLIHFIGTRAGERLALSLAADLSHGEGLLLNEIGSYSLDVVSQKDGSLLLNGRSTEARLPDGSQPESDCLGGMEEDGNWHKSLNLNPGVVTTKAATRKVTLALDTDNELMQLKFSNQTSTASNYLAALVAAMSVIYEKDPAAGGARIRLEIGSQILRPSTTIDPYPSEPGSEILAQLNEFGAYWKANYPYASYPRAFALMISGKSSSANSAQGIAWVLDSGTYCDATGYTWGTQTYGHYSINRVFRFSGSWASNDAPLVAHELGHNFGLSHTHCTNTSGSFPSSTNTLDQCYSGESGCYTGTTSCPSGSPGAPKGTLMSYCHLNSCGSPNAGIIHPVQVTTINNRIASQPASCVVPIGAVNQAPSITAPASITVTEDVASALTGISFSDPDAGSGQLTATFTVAAGALTATGSGVTVGGSATSRTLTGTLSALNSLISGDNLKYTTALNANGSLTLGIHITDNGHSGSGGAKTATASTSLSITAVNDAPTVSAPSWLPVFTSGTAPVTGVSFADVDAGSDSLAVNLQAPAGVTVSGVSANGVTASGSGNTRSFNGTLSALNAYFADARAGLSGPGFSGNGTLVIKINDNGHTGTGGAKNASASVTLRGGLLFANDFE